MHVTGKALWYVESHLQEPLSLEIIAEALQVSPFHLTRAFGETTGHSLAAYVRQRRLSEAANALAGGAQSILDVAVAHGYGSHEAFTRAFGSHFGQSPEEFRRNYQQVPAHKHPSYLEPIRMTPTNTQPLEAPQIADKPELLVYGLTARYDRAAHPGIPGQWDRFLPHLATMANQVGHTAYGVVYNHNGGNAYDYLCAVQVSQPGPEQGGFINLRVPASRYAIFTHRGHISGIGETFRRIWNEALVGLPVAQGPVLEVYGPDFDGRTGNGNVGIWVPLAAA